MSAPSWSWQDVPVVNVVDGDTIDCQFTRTVVCDYGFGIIATTTQTARVRVRLNRINAMPAHTDEGKRATALVQSLTAGQPLSVETLDAYKYGGPNTSPGEWMAEITLTDGANLSDVLVAGGLAVYWDGTGPRPDQLAAQGAR